MEMQGRTLVMIPGEELAALKGTLEKVLAEIKNLQLPKQSVNKEGFITAKEFMAAVRIGRTKFDQLVAGNKIQTIKKLRKIYVPVTEVNRYFSDPNIL
jgi:hypothetical protein